MYKMGARYYAPRYSASRRWIRRVGSSQTRPRSISTSFVVNGLGVAAQGTDG